MDLPFAQSRFCGAEGLSNVVNGSDFRDGSFGQAYGVRLVDGPLAGLFARAVVVVGEDGTVQHVELVPEIAQEPDYDAALAAARMAPTSRSSGVVPASGTWSPTPPTAASRARQSAGRRAIGRSPG